MEQNKAVKQFLDKRFGMFIHWGVYSTLAGAWNGKKIGGELGEWIMNLMQIPVKEYEKIAAKFNPTDFNAEALVKLAHNAGMRYIVITAKHHDGFAMFKSEYDHYNIFDWTPYKRDVVADLAKACKKYDMKLGLYYSQALDWHEEHAGGWDVVPYGMRPSWANVWDYPDNDKKNFVIYFEKKVKPQVTELLTKYGDIFLLWFDTPRTISATQSEELYNLVKSLQPNCLINSRIGNGKGDYGSLGDNQIPTVPLQKANESPVTLNDTWGYKYYDNNWKTKEEIIEMLSKLSSRNVNFLLNIGPMADGNLTKETIEILSGISTWTTSNGEAIYNTAGNPSPSDFDWGYVTAFKDKVYLCFKEDINQTIDFNGLLNKVKRVYSLSDQQNIMFDQDCDSFTLKLHIPKMDLFMPVFAIECDDNIEFDNQIYQQNNVLSLYPLGSKIFDGILKDAQSVLMDNYYVNYDHLGRIKVDHGGILRGWSKSDEFIEWEAKFTNPGSYRVEIITNKSEKITKVSSTCEVIISLSNGYEITTGLKEDFIYSDSRTSINNTRVGTICGSLQVDIPGLYKIKIKIASDVEAGEYEIPLVALKFVLETNS